MFGPYLQPEKILKKLREHISRLLTLIVALQILNMGLFVQEFEPITFTQSSSSSISDNNVINSVVEYVSEVVLNKVNSIPEINSKSNKDLQNHKHFIFKIFEVKQPYTAVPQMGAEIAAKFSGTTNYSYRFCTEINPPPPKSDLIFSKLS